MINFNEKNNFFEIHSTDEEYFIDYEMLKDILDPLILDELYVLKDKPFKSLELIKFYEDIKNKIQMYGTDFVNILVKRLFNLLGINADYRKKGNNNFRTDLIILDEKKLGICEIELGLDTLDSSRGILDNYAVIKSRYGVNNEIVPVIIFQSLPHNRQEYWTVISDIKKVLNIQIYTITLGILYTLVRSNEKFSINKIQDILISSNSSNFRETFKSLDLTNIPIGFGGIFEIEK